MLASGSYKSWSNAEEWGDCRWQERAWGKVISSWDSETVRLLKRAGGGKFWWRRKDFSKPLLKAVQLRKLLSDSNNGWSQDSLARTCEATDEIRYEPFYPCYACPNHFEFSLLKFITMVYSLIKLDYQNLKVFQSFWGAHYRKGSEHLGPLTRYPSQALRTIAVSDLSLCYLNSSSTNILSVAFILSSFFFFFFPLK